MYYYPAELPVGAQLLLRNGLTLKTKKQVSIKDEIQLLELCQAEDATDTFEVIPKEQVH